MPSFDALIADAIAAPFCGVRSDNPSPVYQFVTGPCGRVSRPPQRPLGAPHGLTSVRACWESLHIDTETIDELGTDGVVGIIRGSGSVHGGAPAEYGAVHIFGLRGGKITRFREFVDLARPISP